jgi:ribosomal-protein-alanine N-acetyltransferase
VASPDLVLTTPRLELRLPGREAAPRVVRYFRENEAFLAPWTPPTPPGFYTEAYWRARLPAAREEYRAGTGMRLFLFPRGEPEGAVLGTCNFTQISRGPFQACYLGYGLAERSQGQGLMREALAAALAHVFQALGLHRVMANHLPTNERSARLLRRLGFVVEGYARDYLFVGGAWRDHVLTSLTNPDQQPPPP